MYITVVCGIEIWVQRLVLMTTIWHISFCFDFNLVMLLTDDPRFVCLWNSHDGSLLSKLATSSGLPPAANPASLKVQCRYYELCGCCIVSGHISPPHVVFL